MDQPLRFHWSLSQAGNKFRRAADRKKLSGLINFNDQLNLCLKAEENGIDSVLMAIGFTRPDPLVLAVALGLRTTHIKFLVAVRSGLITPAYYVQQLNTASALIGDRIHVNVVCGHTPNELKYYGDFQAHSKRYERTNEFMEVCNGLWKNEQPVNLKGDYYQVENGIIKTPFNAEKGRPEIYVGGNSVDAANLASNQADCLWRFPDTPEALVPKIEPVLEAGKEVGLLASIIVRPTQEGAQEAANQLLESFAENNRSTHKDFNKSFDSKGFKEVLNKAFNNDSNWITPYLWNGAVPYLGAPSIAFVGSYENIAKALLAYKKIGISQFLFMGWPDEEEIDHFGKGLLPQVRKMENQEQSNSALKMATKNDN